MSVVEKENLLNRPTRAIESIVPVSAASIERHEPMNRLDVMVKWELLTPEDLTVMEPQNEDSTIKPPTEHNAPRNPKNGFQETFKYMKFTGSYAKTSYIRNQMQLVEGIEKGSCHQQGRAKFTKIWEGASIWRSQ